MWSCGIMRHVLDWEVGGSNPGKFLPFSLGCRLDLPIHLDKRDNSGETKYTTLLTRIIIVC